MEAGAQKFSPENAGVVRVAAAAVVRADGKILCARRGDAKNPSVAWKWEFPGGKVEAGETPEIALARELNEELDLPVRVGKKIAAVRHRYAGAAVEIFLETFLCVPAEPAARFRLREHADVRWVAPENLASLDWADADKTAAKILASAPNSFFKK